MTAPAFSPTFSPVPVLPWRGKPAYRGPLIVIPGGRSASRGAVHSTATGAATRPFGQRWRPVGEDRLTPTPISRESADAAHSFRARLSRLPAHPEIQLDCSRRSVRVDGVPRHLTPREFDLLEALAAQPGEPISRDVLLKLGAGPRELGEGSRTVDVHIAHLREKLDLPGLIATIRGRGYALNPAFPVSVN